MQHRSLIRAANLAVFRNELVSLALTADAATGPLSACRRVVIVPTRASAELLRQTIERHARARGQAAVILPDLLTREEWLARLHAALPSPPPMLTRLDREVLLARAAGRAARRGWLPRAPFELRPGLVAAMVNLYDELQRRQRRVRRFATALFDQLRVERGTDRGSESLLHQTCFLGFTFLAYERAVLESGSIDEHVLRSRLLSDQPGLPFDHVVVAVADHPSDPRGLWPADFDLLGRLRHLSRIDVVVTDETHDAGFRDRIERELPGIEERPRASVEPGRPSGAPSRPTLLRPDSRDSDRLCAVGRDREEEIRGVARLIRARAEATAGVLAASTAVVFHRPLPYLYVTQHVFRDARIPFQAFDSLPLRAEPYAALLDLVLACARTGGTREAAVGLLRSNLLQFDVDGARISLADIAALDAALADRRATGEADSYPAEVEAHFGARSTRDRHARDGAARAAHAAAQVRLALLPFRTADRSPDQLSVISAFLRQFQSATPAAPEIRDRHLRARAAVLGVIDSLSASLREFDDRRRSHEDLVALIHHALERQTFTPMRERSGVCLVDGVAARFGEFAHVHLVGLVESDWPERPRRSIFYTRGLLKSLGWPQESDQTRAQQAAFRDLLNLATETVQLHAFQLEGDAPIGASPMIEFARDLPARDDEPRERRRLFPDEVLTTVAEIPHGLEPDAAAWLTLRLARPPLDDVRYCGVVAPVGSQSYRVSKVDRYADCPFKYFSESVLLLPEEREETSGLSPLERGTLVHELFEGFYRAWQEQGQGAITHESLPEALRLFTDLTLRTLARLPEADRALEFTRLLGSIVARGLAERVFELEADAGGTIASRLIESDLRGSFTFPQLFGLKQKTIEIRGKTDRIDVFADGSLRVVDYKLGRMPDLDTSMQIAVYAHCAQQWLEARDGRPHDIRAAMYLAFGDDRQLAGPLGDPRQPAAAAVAARAGEFARTVELIEAGQFPARPRRPGDCRYCRYAGVCRKEYVALPDVEDANDTTAESV